MFKENYLCRSPFTFKFNSEDSHLLTLSNTSEVIRTDKGLDIDWEFKIRKESHSTATSFLCSTKKLEHEMEYKFNVPCYIFMRTKTIISPKTSSSPSKELFPQWNINGEGELKLNPISNFYISLKLKHDKSQLNPLITFANLYKTSNAFFGLDYTFSTNFQNLHRNPLELLIGFTPSEDTMGYVKHSTSNLKRMEKFTLGFYMAKRFVYPWLKRTEEGIKEKNYKGQIQGVVEGSFDYVMRKQITGRIAGKFNSKKRISIQAALNTSLNMTSAIIYHPTKGLNFALSNNVDFKKLLNETKTNFHNYGFTVELTC